MQAPRLIFHPKLPTLVIEPDRLIRALSEIGLLGKSRGTAGDGSFYAGEHFLELLTFLGCSPAIALTPEDGERYCYIDIKTHEQPQFVYGNQPFQPRCSHCRAPIHDWRQQYSPNIDVEKQRIHCDQCGEDSLLSRMNWKHSAGLGRQMIIIHNIYLHEAVPGEKLLQTLESLEPSSRWEYFYTL
jgi:hypothetical protein